MTDSMDVLNTVFVAYTAYAVAIISLFAWFAYKLTRGKTRRLIPNVAFYSYIGLLVIIGVSLHIVTYHKIPWVAMDLKRHHIKPDKTFKILAKDHQFLLPEKPLVVRCNEVVKFDVDSKDLTYGFGLFRADQSMVFQMQVVPGSENVILWRFPKNGIYTIRSTEYSGPKGAHMMVKNAVKVVGCKEDDLRAKAL